MTPDALTFDLVDRLAAISVSRGRVSYLHENDLYDITNTNFGRFLLESQGWEPAQSAQRSSDRQAFQRPETGTIQ
jgi:hypothetical protein